MICRSRRLKLEPWSLVPLIPGFLPMLEKQQYAKRLAGPTAVSTPLCWIFSTADVGPALAGREGLGGTRSPYPVGVEPTGVRRAQLALQSLFSLELVHCIGPSPMVAGFVLSVFEAGATVRVV